MNFAVKNIKKSLTARINKRLDDESQKNDCKSSFPTSFKNWTHLKQYKGTRHCWLDYLFEFTNELEKCKNIVEAEEMKS